jgi:hypothetical protein
MTLVLVVGIVAALMATSSPYNLASATCGISGCVSTPPLSSSTSYLYTATSVASITAVTSTISTSFSTSTTSTTATTTSTFWSYTSTISTTITTTSYSTVYTSTQSSLNTYVSTIPSTTTSTATFTNVATSQGVSTTCPVSYVTNGNRLQPYAQFLRNFRDNRIENTTAGRTFLTTFNAWYYSWAPAVAYSAATSPYAYTAVQATVIPLLGILYASYYSYTLVAPLSVEAAAITAGLVAASLIGVVYFAPIAYVASRIIRRRSHITITRWTLGPSAAWFAASIIMALTAYATGSVNLLAFATSSLVLSTLSLATLTSTRLMMYVQLPSVNAANMALLLRRFTRTFP